MNTKTAMEKTALCKKKNLTVCFTNKKLKIKSAAMARCGSAEFGPRNVGRQII